MPHEKPGKEASATDWSDRARWAQERDHQSHWGYRYKVDFIEEKLTSREVVKCEQSLKNLIISRLILGMNGLRAPWAMFHRKEP